MGRELTIETSELIDLYKSLGTIKKVSDITGIHQSTVYYRLKDTGVVKKWEKDVDNEELISCYKETQSIRKVGLRFGISQETARYKLKALGVINKPLTRCSVDDDFFFRDNPESFYWAGFIAADGCVKLKDKKYKQLSIGLATRDKEHIGKFITAVKYSGKLNFKEGDTAASVCISSDKLFDDLARFGVIERKSLVLRFPEWLIAHALVSHFMRGYNDGDGSFYFHGPRLSEGRVVPQLHFSLRGTEQFLTAFSKVLSKNCEINFKKPRANSGIYMLEWGGNGVLTKIKGFLYKDSNNSIQLDRKFILSSDKKFDPVGRLRSVIATSIETGEEIRFKSIGNAVDAGFTRSSISECCRKIRNHHKGYTWKYETEPTTPVMPRKKYGKMVIATNILSGEEITFGSASIAFESGFKSSDISACCCGRQKTHKGYAWKYLEKEIAQDTIVTENTNKSVDMPFQIMSNQEPNNGNT